MAIHPTTTPAGETAQRHPMPLSSDVDRPSWPSDEHEHPPGGGRSAGEISARIVRLLREHTGRGPREAKTTLSSDLIVVSLGGCLSTAESRLVRAQQGELVARARRVLHLGVRAGAIAIVEEVTQRQVTTYLTDQQLTPDLAILVFMLAPETPESV